MSDKIKTIVQKAGPLRLGAVIVCGAILLLLSTGAMEGEKKVTQEETSEEKQTDLTYYRRQMEDELVELLRKVQGVGQVEVMITLRASNEKVTLKDNADKGDRREEETVLIEDSERNSSPYVLKEKEPELEGVVIVCEGGDDAAVKREITGAVSALFQVESHKIKVMKSKEAKE